MGRKKLKKPGRQRTHQGRHGTYTLQQLQPPGYDEWLHIKADFTAAAAVSDPRLNAEAVDLMQRFERLRPLYRGPIPMQAVRLDMVLDTGALPISYGDGERVSLLPLEQAATLMGAASTGEDLRTPMHRLHSVGALLVEEADHDIPVIRLVSQPPGRPGEPWILHGSPEAESVPQTCIPASPGDLEPGEFAALAYIRTCMAQRREPEAHKFAQHEGVESLEQARALFAAVAELAQEKGCSACPAAHLCTRAPEDDEVTV
ncbi:hypothetical protein AB0K64_29605 [Streptomyces sp. NPDC053741]|uniref:hypothetical protein n=1 Tax=Streptomyces TaxID=1883 RepID=UPI002F911379